MSISLWTHTICVMLTFAAIWKNHLFYEQFAKCLKIDIVIGNEGQERQRKDFFFLHHFIMSRLKLQRWWTKLPTTPFNSIFFFSHCSNHHPLKFLQFFMSLLLLNKFYFNIALTAAFLRMKHNQKCEIK